MKPTRCSSRLVLTVAAFLLPASAGIRITENTAQRVSFTWHLDNYDAQTVEGGGLATVLSFDGQNYDLGDKGEPRVPAFSLMVGVPPVGGIRVVFNSHRVESKTIPHPVGTWPTLKGESGRGGPVFGSPWISQPDYQVMKRIRAAQLVIRPFLYEQGSRRVRVLREGSCTIYFPASQTYPRIAPRSDFHRMLRRLLLNYDIATRWIPPPDPAQAKRAATSAFALSSGTMVRFSIGDGHSGVNECTINENGLVRIPGTTVAQLGSSVRMDRVSLYGSRKGELPDTASAVIPDGIVEVPLLRFDLNDDGWVDPSDYLVAYVTGSSDWTATPAGLTDNFEMNLDRFGDSRNYWIVAHASDTGLDLASFTEPAAGGETVTTFTNRICYKYPDRLPSGWEGGVDRIWKRITAGSPVFTYPVSMPGVVGSATGYVRFGGFAPPSGVGSTARVKIAMGDGTEVCTGCSANLWQEVTSFGERAATGGVRFVAEGTGNASYEIGQFEIKYQRNLDMNGLSALTVFSSSDSGIVTYRLANPPSATFYIVRVTPDESAMSLVNPTVSGGTCTWSDTGGIGIRYFVSTGSAIGTIAETHLVNVPGNSGFMVNNLRSTSNRGNYIIVTDSMFLSAATTLAAHKKSYGAFESPNPKIALTHSIYREFSGGNVDPAAIRNFLAYADRHWPGGVEYVVFLGNGHWDYKHTVTNEPLYIPTAQVGSGESQKCIEDYFACLDPGETHSGGADVFLGRIPCDSPDEAREIVNKVRLTEDPALAEFGAWRNRVLLVADDDMQGDKPDNITNHHTSSESVGVRILRQSPSVDIRKVYLFEYEWDEVYEKPEATRAIANEVNNGVMCINWFGHGSDILWADEHVLAIDNINVLQNSPRFPLISSFSCSVGKFDKPEHDAMSDALVKFRDAGAVAAIASTRLAYASSNTSLALVFFDSLFQVSSARTLGAAYREAMTTYGANKQYAFLGDPSIRFVNAGHEVNLRVTSTSGAQLDTLKALQSIIIKGSVHEKGMSAVDTDFGTQSRPAYVELGVYNAPDTSHRKDGGTRDVTPYTLPGTPVFIATIPVSSGVFQQTLRLPLNLSFDVDGPKVTAFAWQGGKNGLGIKKLTFSGTERGEVDDTTGPQITIRPVYTDEERNATATFTDRIAVSLPMEIEIELHDESGLDVAGVSPDEGLTVEIPGALGKRNVNQNFRFNEGDFRTGVASMAFEKNEIDPGTYTIVIGAQDLLGNASSKEFELEVVPETEFRMGPVYNYPNPMRMGTTTRFFFYTTAASPQWEDDGVRTAIRIYTLSGKLVKVLTGEGSGAQNGVQWNGRDETGWTLGPNVYLYRVTAEYTKEGQTTVAKSPIQKLVIHPPRR